MKGYANRKAFLSVTERNFLQPNRRISASLKRVPLLWSSVKFVKPTLALSNDYTRSYKTNITTSTSSRNYIMNNTTTRSISQTKYEKEMTEKTLAIARAIIADPNEDENIDGGRRLNQRRALSKAITLIESRSRDHIFQGDLLLNYLIESNRLKENKSCTKNKKNAPFRIGIAGAPGAGKVQHEENP